MCFVRVHCARMETGLGSAAVSRLTAWSDVVCFSLCGSILRRCVDRRFPCVLCACIVHGWKPGLAAPRSADSPRGPMSFVSHFVGPFFGDVLIGAFHVFCARALCTDGNRAWQRRGQPTHRVVRCRLFLTLWVHSSAMC